jgi:hypothetical protein
MKLKTTNMLCVACFIVSLIIPSLVFSQQKAETGPQVKEQPKQTTTGKRVHPREEYAPDQRPEEDYLARFKGIEVSERLMQENLENIYILKVIVVNFKENGWEKEYNDIYEEYKKAVAKYYRRQVIYSRLELERNKKHINDLFKKIVVVYQDQAYTMLDECADKILNFSLDERNKYDPNRSRVLFQNMMRLWIAYGQTDDSDASILDNQYKSAVYHLRISKAYAINILEDLSPEGSKKEQFRVHKADNMNRVLSGETAKSTSPNPQTSPK